MTTEVRTYQAPASIGACVAALAVEDAVAVLHGGAGCDIKLHTLLRAHNPSGAVHHRVVCTKIAEAALVLDPGEVLGRAISTIVRRVDARMVLVTSASFIEISGLDRERLLAELDARLGLPSVYVYAPDFAGDLFDGYHKAVAAIADRFTRDAPPPSVPVAGRVNVVGYVHDRPYLEHRANAAALASLVSAAGLMLNVTLLDGSGTSAIARLPDASLSVVLPGGEPAADVLAANLGHDRVAVPLPLGLDATRAFVEAVAARGDPAAAAAFLEAGEARVRFLLRQAAEPLTGRRVALFADGPRMAGLLGLCRDLKLVPVVAGVLDGRVGALGDPGLPGLEVLVDPGQPTTLERIRRAAADREVDLVVGTAHEALMARKAGLPALEFGFPCRAYQALYPVPYLGHDGVLAMASRLLEVLG